MGQPQQKNSYTEEEMRSEIISTLERMDKSFLRVVHSMMRTYAEEQLEEVTPEDAIVDYQEDGTAITAREFKLEADAIVEDVKAGNYITLEQLKEKRDKWAESIK